MREAAKLCRIYNQRIGRWPVDVQALQNTILIFDTNVLFDAWGHLLVFTWQPSGLVIVSTGKDGQLGGQGEGADLFLEVQ